MRFGGFFIFRLRCLRRRRRLWLRRGRDVAFLCFEYLFGKGEIARCYCAFDITLYIEPLFETYTYLILSDQI
jgi:hypothetical protein